MALRGIGFLGTNNQVFGRRHQTAQANIFYRFAGRSLRGAEAWHRIGQADSVQATTCPRHGSVIAIYRRKMKSMPKMKCKILAALLMVPLLVAPAPLTAAQTPSLQDQALCARQAEKVYDDRLSHAWNRSQIFGPSFESHYNLKLQVCLVLIRIDWSTPIIRQYSLIDAFGGHVFGTYYWTNPKNTENCKVGAVCSYGTQTCKVGETVCSSEDEFYAAVEKYMTN
jgi:hypothetical protein